MLNTQFSEPINTPAAAIPAAAPCQMPSVVARKHFHLRFSDFNCSGTLCGAAHSAADSGAEIVAAYESNTSWCATRACSLPYLPPFVASYLSPQVLSASIFLFLPICASLSHHFAYRHHCVWFMCCYDPPCRFPSTWYIPTVDLVDIFATVCPPEEGRRGGDTVASCLGTEGFRQVDLAMVLFWVGGVHEGLQTLLVKNRSEAPQPGDPGPAHQSSTTCTHTSTACSHHQNPVRTTSTGVP